MTNVWIWVQPVGAVMVAVGIEPLRTVETLARIKSPSAVPAGLVHTPLAAEILLRYATAIYGQVTVIASAALVTVVT